MTMLKIEIGFVLLLAAFLIAFSLLGLLHYDYSANLMRFPLLAAGSTLAVLVVHLAMMRRGTTVSVDAGPAASALIAALKSSRRRQALVRLLSVFSIVPLVFILGYPLGLAIYLLCVLRYLGERWALSSAIAGTSLVVSYGLFVRILGVPLPIMPSWWPLVAG